MISTARADASVESPRTLSGSDWISLAAFAGWSPERLSYPASFPFPFLPLPGWLESRVANAVAVAVACPSRLEAEDGAAAAAAGGASAPGAAAVEDPDAARSSAAAGSARPITQSAEAEPSARPSHARETAGRGSERSSASGGSKP